MRIFWGGGTVCRSSVVWGDQQGGSEDSVLPILLGGGGLCVVEVTGAAVGVIVWHANGGTVQVEVAAAWAAREAADWTAAPGQDDKGRGEKKLSSRMLSGVGEQFGCFEIFPSCQLWGVVLPLALFVA